MKYMTFLSILVVSLMMLSCVEADCTPGNRKGECDEYEVWIFLSFKIIYDVVLAYIFVFIFTS